MVQRPTWVNLSLIWKVCAFGGLKKKLYSQSGRSSSSTSSPTPPVFLETKAHTSTRSMTAYQDSIAPFATRWRDLPEPLTTPTTYKDFYLSMMGKLVQMRGLLEASESRHNIVDGYQEVSHRFVTDLKRLVTTVKFPDSKTTSSDNEYKILSEKLCEKLQLLFFLAGHFDTVEKELYIGLVSDWMEENVVF